MTIPYSRGTVVLALILAVASCGDVASAEWGGSIDTLATGQVVVRNPRAPLWSEEEAWRLTEELRIGKVAGESPELFGQITSLTVDPAGRIYVLEGQAQEVRAFGPDGSHARTFGRKGGGPGEFARALRIELGPDGNLWVADPQNNRVSVFDTAGAYLEGHPTAGGFTLIPWPGRFDRHGHYYFPVPLPSESDFRLGLVRYGFDMQPLDTLSVPDDPVEPAFFEIRHEDGGVARASVPFTAGFRWRLAPAGTFWGFLTGEYRMFELAAAGDTLRTITREYAPLPVTDADLEEARENLEWFIEQGGRVDWSAIPSQKPAIEYAFVDDEDHLWVWPVMPPGEEGMALDVFDPVGRYLGRVEPPVPIARRPTPVIRHGAMYAVTTSELDVPFVVRLAIDKPASASSLAGR